MKNFVIFCCIWLIGSGALIAQEAPTTAEGWLEAGDAVALIYDFDAAIAAYSQAIELDAGSAEAFIARAEMYVQLRQLDDARADLDSAVALGSIDAYIARANFRRTQGDLDGARQDIATALGIDDQNSHVYRQRALIRRDAGELQIAIEDLNTAVDLAPEDPGAYTARGNFFAHFNDFQNAIRNYDAALLFDENYAPAYRQRGNAYGAIGNWTTGLLDLNRAIELAPNDTRGYFLRGNLLGALGEYAGAVEDFTRVIELNPLDVAGYRLRADSNRLEATMLERLSVPVDFDIYRQRALEDYTRALAIDPDDEGSRFGRALTYAEMGEAENALADFDILLEGVPEDAIPPELRTILDDLRAQVGR